MIRLPGVAGCVVLHTYPLYCIPTNCTAFPRSLSLTLRRSSVSGSSTQSRWTSAWRMPSGEEVLPGLIAELQPLQQGCRHSEVKTSRVATAVMHLMMRFQMHLVEAVLHADCCHCRHTVKKSLQELSRLLNGDAKTEVRSVVQVAQSRLFDLHALCNGLYVHLNNCVLHRPCYHIPVLAPWLPTASSPAHSHCSGVPHLPHDHGS
jgi:hypothetical protein